MRVARLGLRGRLVFTFAATLVAILAANAAYLLLAGRSTSRARLEGAARQFALLATPILGQAFDTYFHSGYFKFRQLVLDLLSRSEDVTAIQVADVEGRVLFDSRRLDSSADGAGEEHLSAERLEAVRRVQPSELRSPVAAEGSLEIVVPFLEDWGRHRLSVIYHVSLASLDGQLRRGARRALQLVLISGAIVSVLGLALGTRLTRPLAALAEGVQEVARGNYDRRLAIRSGDELQVVAEAFNDMSGRLRQTIGDLQRSVTETRRVQEEREGLLVEMERRNAELERFTYTVSHDLRSPLVTVRGFLGFLESDIASGRTDRAAEDVARIRAATETMERLLKELLDLSRVGRVANPSEDIPLGDLAEEARSVLAGVLEAAGATVEVAPGLPTVFGDRARLREVMQNLLENAAKFASPGVPPRIRVGARPGADGPVCFVEDDGIGVEPRQHQRVFGLFERLDPEVEGTGIGLALVKRIVEVHGGRVWVESEGAGRGSRFCFTLAPRPGREPVPEEASGDQEGDRGEGR